MTGGRAEFGAEAVARLNDDGSAVVTLSSAGRSEQVVVAKEHIDAKVAEYIGRRVAEGTRFWAENENDGQLRRVRAAIELAASGVT